MNSTGCAGDNEAERQSGTSVAPRTSSKEKNIAGPVGVGQQEAQQPPRLPLQSGSLWKRLRTHPRTGEPIIMALQVFAMVRVGK